MKGHNLKNMVMGPLFAVLDQRHAETQDVFAEYRETNRILFYQISDESPTFRVRGQAK